MIQKIIDTFKTKQGVIGALSLKTKQVIFGDNLNPNIINLSFEVIEKIENLENFDYLSFNIDNQAIIAFKKQDDIIILVGDSNLKEPVIRIAIKSL
jgi:hypothetical protein